MVRFGVCTALEKSAQAKALGWDFVEENVQGLFQGLLPDADYHGLQRVKTSALPVPAANCLVPGDLKIVGPAADRARLSQYMQAVLKRASAAGTTMLVFGSGGARKIPDGFDRQTARRQICEFSSDSARIAAEHGVTLVLEPLNKGETNVVNSVTEAMEYVRDVNHPNFACLVDSFHLWVENEPLANVAAAARWIRHVHVADLDGRVAPGLSGKSDYRPLFGVLKSAGYDGMISVEAMGFDLTTQGAGALALLRKQWDEAPRT